MLTVPAQRTPRWRLPSAQRPTDPPRLGTLDTSPLQYHLKYHPSTSINAIRRHRSYGYTPRPRSGGVYR
jgi:hypothetical protein